MRDRGVGPSEAASHGNLHRSRAEQELVHFATFVRQTEKRNLQIINRSNSEWVLKPTIESDVPYWTGPETFLVDPQSMRNYELIYRPLSMTLEGKKHAVCTLHRIHYSSIYIRTYSNLYSS